MYTNLLNDTQYNTILNRDRTTSSCDHSQVLLLSPSLSLSFSLSLFHLSRVLVVQHWRRLSYPKVNFSDDPMLAKLCVTPLLATGIVSDRCILFPICVDSSNVALLWPRNSIGLSLYMLLLRAVAAEAAISGCTCCVVVGVDSSSLSAPNGSFWVTGVRGEILRRR